MYVYPDLDLTDGFESMIAFADSYLSATNLLVRHQRETNFLFTFAPLYQNAGHSCELLLKTLIYGYDENVNSIKDLSKFGHDLEALLDRCLKVRVPFFDILEPVRKRHIQSEIPLGMSQEDLGKPFVVNWLTNFDSQVMALNENYTKFEDEKQREFRTRYPNSKRNFKPVNLCYLLPCLDKIRDHTHSLRN